jgi:glycosyltransferase involved in cell wall biosynthesis
LHPSQILNLQSYVDGDLILTEESHAIIQEAIEVAPLRVLIVSENISMRMGGEASLPFYYAKLFLRRGAEVWLACHERVEGELRAAFPELESRMRFVRDTPAQKAAFRFGNVLPYRLRDMLIGQGIHFSTQMRIRAVAIELSRAGRIDVVFEPSPITPKGLSFMYNLGVPVVIGPLCGGMNFPPAFADLDSIVTRATVGLGRYLSRLANLLVPGKIEADVLLVANTSTLTAVPAKNHRRVQHLFESGVDLDIWKPAEISAGRTDDRVHFVFSGRFVDWKGIQYLIPAFAKAVAQEPRCRLDLIGGGELENEIKAMIEHNKLSESVRLHGWVSRDEAARIIREADVFVMPSLRECGGTAILEALALGKPVIATNWGGPADYVDARCGILVDPNSKAGFVDGLTKAIVRLARSAALRKSLGEYGKFRVCNDYLDWKSKADRVLSILSEVANRN